MIVISYVVHIIQRIILLFLQQMHEDLFSLHTIELALLLI